MLALVIKFGSEHTHAAAISILGFCSNVHILFCLQLAIDIHSGMASTILINKAAGKIFGKVGCALLNMGLDAHLHFILSSTSSGNSHVTANSIINIILFVGLFYIAIFQNIGINIGTCANGGSGLGIGKGKWHI